MLHLHPANPPPHDLAGLRRSLALAGPPHAGHAFREITWYPGVVVQTICRVSVPPSR